MSQEDPTKPPDGHVPHEYRAIEDITEGMTQAYAAMVRGPLMADIKRWAKRVAKEAKKGMVK